MTRLLLMMLVMPIMLGCENDKTDWSTVTPTFEDFKISGKCNLRTKKRKLDFSNLDFTREEQKEIREEYLAPHNYLNCRYSSSTLVGPDETWRHIVINTQSGEIIGELQSLSGITFSKQSALIILNPPGGIEEPKGTIEYWIIENDELKRI